MGEVVLGASPLLLAHREPVARKCWPPAFPRKLRHIAFTYGRDSGMGVKGHKTKACTGKPLAHVAHKGLVHITHAADYDPACLGLARSHKRGRLIQVFTQGFLEFRPGQDGGIGPKGKEGLLGCAIAPKGPFPVVEHLQKRKIQVFGACPVGCKGPSHPLPALLRVAGKEHLQGVSLAGERGCKRLGEPLAHGLVLLWAYKAQGALKLHQGDHGSVVGNQYAKAIPSLSSALRATLFITQLITGMQGAERGGCYAEKVPHGQNTAVERGKKSFKGHVSSYCMLWRLVVTRLEMATPMG